MSNATPNKGTAKTKSAPKRKKILIALSSVFIVVLAVSFGLGFYKDRQSAKACILETYSPTAVLPDVIGYEPEKTCIDFEWVVTPEDQAIGLSKYDTYSDYKGMIFEYNTPNKACMWMKDMKFPIDMVWLDVDKRIVKLEHNVSPKTYPETFCSDTPAKYVIELNRSISEITELEIGQQLPL